MIFDEEFKKIRNEIQKMTKAGFDSGSRDASVRSLVSGDFNDSENPLVKELEFLAVRYADEGRPDIGKIIAVVSAMESLGVTPALCQAVEISSREITEDYAALSGFVSLAIKVGVDINSPELHKAMRQY